jgi:hypothetical protein
MIIADLHLAGFDLWAPTRHSAARCVLDQHLRRISMAMTRLMK